MIRLLNQQDASTILYFLIFFLIIIYQYANDIKQEYYTSPLIFLYIGTSHLVYSKLHIFAPLLQ